MKRLLFTALAAGLVTPLLADPPDWRNNQLLQPEKITVGPSDNYQARVDADQQHLYFTRHQNLVSRVVRQNLSTGQTRELLPPDQDARDPALSPDGRYLALTSYRGNALGSVCVLPLQGEDPELNCKTPDGQRAWLPFWVDQQTLGYLRRSRQGREQELVFHRLGGEPRVQVRGRLSAPSVSSDGRYLIYQRHEAERRGIHVRDLHTERQYGPLQLDLPGLSSYSLYNPDDGYLYFSHYLSDTSGDQQIDAEDHSVIFRAPLQRLLEAEQPLLPQQLTSVALNCNFPALAGDQLYLTCAYEGSLDTYRLPLTGQLPTHWQTEQLHQARDTASREAERLLLLNTLRYQAGETRIEDLQRLLANHLQMGELTAAGYYTAQLQQRVTAADEQAFYRDLAVLLQLRADRRMQPPGQLTPHYRRQLQAATEQMQQEASRPVFLAWLDWLGRDAASAAVRLAAAEPGLPLEAYLQQQLALRLAATPEQEREARLQAATSEVIAPDARLFHAFHYLQLLTRQHRDNPDAHREALENARTQLEDSRLQAFFANELDLLALAAADERTEERSLYQAISGRLRDWRDQPALHRASHIRAVQIMGLAEKYDFMELMSRHWLTTTDIRHVSFAASASQYATINLNRGYGAWSQGEDNTALNTFYSVLRQTSDLEALYNLLRLGLDAEADPALQERMQRLYDQLIAEQLLGNNALYAEALRPLLTSKSPNQKQLQEAADQLRQLQVSGLDAGVRDLLLGYVYHRQLLATQKGYQRDQGLAQQAHYHYMLGLDLAYRNPRIQAAVLENLGQLHFQLGNHGLAAEFYAQRLTLPWLSREQQLWLHWRQARALYYSNRPQRAAEQSEAALALAQELSSPELTPVRERTAFYQLHAGQHERARELYQALLDEEALDGNNAIKARFALATALYREGQQEAARTAFNALLDELPAATPVAARNDRLVAFEPRRLQVQSYGYLARLSATPRERIEWLERRLELLNRMQSRDRRYAWDEAGRYSLILKTRLQKAEAHESLGQLNRTAAEMRQVLKEVEDYRKAQGPVGSEPVLQSLYNYLTLGSYHPEAFAQEPRALQQLLDATLEELHQEIFMPPVNHYQRLKIQLLHQLYRWRQGQQSVGRLLREVDALEADEAWTGLALTRPDLLQELNELARGIRQLAASN